MESTFRGSKSEKSLSLCLIMKMLHHNLIVQNPLCCHFLSPPTLNTLHETQLAHMFRQLHPVMVSLSIHRRAWLIPLNIHDELFIILQSPPTDSTIKIPKRPYLENGSSSRQLSIFRSPGEIRNNVMEYVLVPGDVRPSSSASANPAQRLALQDGLLMRESR